MWAIVGSASTNRETRASLRTKEPRPADVATESRVSIDEKGKARECRCSRQLKNQVAARYEIAGLDAQ